jgi:hypothetical protein
LLQDHQKVPTYVVTYPLHSKLNCKTEKKEGKKRQLSIHRTKQEEASCEKNHKTRNQGKAQLPVIETEHQGLLVEGHAAAVKIKAVKH